MILQKGMVLVKAAYDKAVLAARDILRQIARQNSVSYEEVYEGFEDAIRHGLASTEPQAIQFWDAVKKQARKEVPTPEDVLVYIFAVSSDIAGNRHPGIDFVKYTFH